MRIRSVLQCAAPEVAPVALLWLLSALVVMVAVAGTERLGRPLTDEESKRFGALLREHDYPGVRLIALRFAYRLTRSLERAKDLMGRADERLVRFGWDPQAVPLNVLLCRLVWSEWTHETKETDAARRAAAGYLREVHTTGVVSVPSTEQQAIGVEGERAARAHAETQLEKLRAAFEADGDEVNLLWLEHASRGESDMQKMAAASGRDVSEFYAASKRRKRAVRRLLGEARGVKYGKDEP
jgi:hypothetical protein